MSAFDTVRAALNLMGSVRVVGVAAGEQVADMKENALAALAEIEREQEKWKRLALNANGKLAVALARAERADGCVWVKDSNYYAAAEVLGLAADGTAEPRRYLCGRAKPCGMAGCHCQAAADGTAE